MGIFTGLFKSRDKPQNSYDSPSYTYFFGRANSGKRVTDRTAFQRNFLMTAYLTCRHILPVNLQEESVQRKKRHSLLVTETTGAGVTKEVQILEFLIRQSPVSLNINSTAFRILFRNNIYDITGITPLYDHNSYMKIEGETRRAGNFDDIN